MNTRFKVFASYNILQYLCDFIHVLIFVVVSKCQKSSNLTNIVFLLVYSIWSMKCRYDPKYASQYKSKHTKHLKLF